jgi:hypothetical protein
MSENMSVWEAAPGAAGVDDDADIIQGKAVADGIVREKLVAPLVVLTCGITRFSPIVSIGQVNNSGVESHPGLWKAC